MFTIGSIVAVEDPATFREIPDDRIQNVPCIDGTYLEDLGMNDAGRTFDVSITINRSDYTTLRSYRLSKTAVQVTDHRGENLGVRGFKIKGVSYVAGCDMVQVELELLRRVD